MRRGLTVAALALTAASCGGQTPAAPSSDASPRTVILDPGSYTLALSFARSGSAVSFCTGSPEPLNAEYPATVTRSGQFATASVAPSAGSLSLNLRLDGVTVSGGIDGAARDASGTTVSVTGTIIGTAPANPGIAVSGTIDGTMNVPGGGCSNNGHAWSLRRQ